MGDSKRNHYRDLVERFLSSGMGIGSWCSLNHVSKSNLYYWLAIFRDEEPDVFGGFEIAHAGDGNRFWLKSVMDAYRKSYAIEKANQPQTTVATHKDSGASDFLVLDTNALYQQSSDTISPQTNHSNAPDITVRIGDVTIAIPHGSEVDDIANVCKVVASL